jgi:hypothetical protein
MDLATDVVGWCFALFCSYFLFFTVLPEYWSFPDHPSAMTADEAARAAESGRQVWVSLTDLQWNCDPAAKRSDLMFVNFPGGRRVVVSLPRKGVCWDLPEPPTGVLHPASPRRRSHLERNRGLKISAEDEPLLEFCTYCGPENSRLGLLILPFLILFGLFLRPLVRARYRSGWSR